MKCAKCGKEHNSDDVVYISAKKCLCENCFNASVNLTNGNVANGVVRFLKLQKTRLGLISKAQ